MVRCDEGTAIWAKLTERSVAVMNYTEMEAKVSQFIWAGGGLSLCARQGSRSHKQRALGGIVDVDARNLKRNP